MTSMHTHRSWFRAANVKKFVVDSFSLTDEEGFLCAWDERLFAFKNCDERKFFGVTLNGEEIHA